MGQMAEDITDGTCCEECYQYFESNKTEKKGRTLLFTHGYPVTCGRCWNRLTVSERTDRSKAKARTI